MKSKKFSKVITVAVIVLSFFTQTAYAGIPTTSNSNDTITIEVIVNKFGEDSLKNIEFDDGTKVSDYNYKIKYVNQKITRDPAYMATYFSQALWITRNNIVSLSLVPNSNVRNSLSEKNKAWTILSGEYTGLGSSKYWPKDEQKLKTFKWQFDCHYHFANNKNEWNIEPSRSASSYAAVVAKKCNP